MVSDYKMAISLWKLTPKVNMHLALALVFFVFGILYDSLLKGANAVSALYFALPCTFVHTSFVATNLSGMIQSSTVRKKIFTTFPNLFIIPYILLAYLGLGAFHLYLGMQPVNAVDYATNAALQGRYFLFAGIEILILLAYSAVGNKLLFSGAVVFVITILPIMLFSQSRHTPWLFAFCDGHLIGCFLFGLVMVIIGCVLSVFLTHLLYKRDLSELALKSLARSYIK